MSVLRGLDKGSLCCSWAPLTLKGGIDAGTAPSVRPAAAAGPASTDGNADRCRAAKALKSHQRNGVKENITVVSSEFFTKISGSLLNDGDLNGNSPIQT